MQTLMLILKNQWQKASNCFKKIFPWFVNLDMVFNFTNCPSIQFRSLNFLFLC